MAVLFVKQWKKKRKVDAGTTPKSEVIVIEDHNHPITNEIGMRIYKRDLPPAHYWLKMESFSLFPMGGDEAYESAVFEVGGYKWRVLFYPNGKKKMNINGFISFYLEIAETESLPVAWEVNASFKLFVLDRTRDKFLTIEDGLFRKFYPLKTKWGFDKLLSLEFFNDPSGGYLVHDSCVFGAELFVHQRTGKGECLSLVKPFSSNTIFFKLENFSKLDKEFYDSQVYAVEGLKWWKLRVYPEGVESSMGSALSVFLMLVEAPKVPLGKKFHVEYKLRVRDQISTNHHEKTHGRGWIFSKSPPGYGFQSLIPLRDLHAAWNGLVVNDTVMVEADIVVLSKHYYF